MSTSDVAKKRLALVYGTLPSVEEIDQFLIIANQFDVTVVAAESIIGYLTQTCRFDQLACIPLPDHSENTTYLPGLEKALVGFDLVVIKERLGMYAFQAVKAKWRSRFRLVVWVDNLTPLPGEDVVHMRTIRREVEAAADAFLVQSEAAAAVLELEGIDRRRMVSFPPFVECRAKRSGAGRAKAAQVLGLGDTDFIIAHLGQIEWEEGLFDLAHAMKLVSLADRSLGDRLRLVFCGIGSFSGELRDRLVALGLDRQAVYVAPSREAFATVLTAADCVYYAPSPARDRVEGDPYRLATPMVHGVPVLASRGALVEEVLGKHRLDFCPGSADSLAKAIRRAAGAQGLRADVAKKLLVKAPRKVDVARTMNEAFTSVLKRAPTVDVSALDHQVLEVESLVATKQYLAAIDIIEQVFRLREVPIHHRANLLRLIGDCFTKLGDSDQGKNAYGQAIDLDPYSAKAHIGLGTIGLMKQAHESAVIQFQKAVSLAPEDEMANLGLGLAFQGLGEQDEASRWVVKALEINPENTAGLYTLVQLADERERWGDAQVALERYVALHPHDHNLLYTLAAIKFKIGDHAIAKDLIERIIAVDPYNERAQALDRQVRRALGGAAELSNG